MSSSLVGWRKNGLGSSKSSLIVFDCVWLIHQAYIGLGWRWCSLSWSHIIGKREDDEDQEILMMIKESLRIQNVKDIGRLVF